ncbi:MAG: hypothetical protein JNM07_03180 [Phycisphaerae bacterium]|nr:hypothetical protein [Phycisphaerae bacterium]
MHSLRRRGQVVLGLGFAVAASSVVAAGAALLVESGMSPGDFVVCLAPISTAAQQPAVHPSLKYLGNGSCTGSKCHSGEAKDQSGHLIGDEFTIWQEKDPHAKAYKTLSSKASGEIATKMKLGDAKAANRCLACHSTQVPAAQRGEKWKIEDSVGCERCHGASEKWKEPHQKAGWTEAERKKGGADSLNKNWGLIDTSDLAVRGTMCVSCHLQIDQDMVEAGHPTLKFEMYDYNNYHFAKQFRPHWDERGGPTSAAKLWAVGQAASLAAATSKEAASLKPLVAVYQAGVQVVKSAFGSGDAATLSAMTMTKEQAIKAANELAATGDAFKSGAENERARKIIASGVEGLVSACVKDPDKDLSDEFWAASETARKASEGDAWLAALKRMTSFAK